MSLSGRTADDNHYKVCDREILKNYLHICDGNSGGSFVEKFLKLGLNLNMAQSRVRRIAVLFPLALLETWSGPDTSSIWVSYQPQISFDRHEITLSDGYRYTAPGEFFGLVEAGVRLNPRWTLANALSLFHGYTLTAGFKPLIWNSGSVGLIGSFGGLSRRVHTSGSILALQRIESSLLGAFHIFSTIQYWGGQFDLQQQGHGPSHWMTYNGVTVIEHVLTPALGIDFGVKDFHVVFGGGYHAVLVTHVLAEERPSDFRHGSGFVVFGKFTYEFGKKDMRKRDNAGSIPTF